MLSIKIYRLLHRGFILIRLGCKMTTSTAMKERYEQKPWVCMPTSLFPLSNLTIKVEGFLPLQSPFQNISFPEPWVVMLGILKMKMMGWTDSTL